MKPLNLLNFARDQLPDHGDLLAAIARWCLRGDLPFAVEAPGLIDCRLFRTQAGDGVLHLVNLNNPNAWRTPVQETVPTGPVRVRVKTRGPARALVGEARLSQRQAGDWRVIDIPRIAEHEVLVFPLTPAK